MKQLALFIPAAVFAITALSLSFPTQVESREPDGRRATTARPGFYLQVERCHACSYKDWQKDTAMALEKSGVQSFVSDVITSHTSEQGYVTIRELPLRKVRSEGWPLPVYAGPFTSENQAREVITRLPAILEPAFNKFLKLNAETEKAIGTSHRLENCSGNHCSLAGYSINLVRVAGSANDSAKSTGAMDEPISIGVVRDTSAIGGCSCYFSPVSPGGKIGSEGYIFFADYAGKARMNINGRDVELQEVGREQAKGELGRCSKKRCKYTASGISATVDYRETNKCPPEPNGGCEVTGYDVTITVEKSGQRQKMKGKGECGC